MLYDKKLLSALQIRDYPNLSISNKNINGPKSWELNTFYCMGEKNSNSLTLEIQILNPAVFLLNSQSFKFNWSIVFRKTKNKSERLI